MGQTSQLYVNLPIGTSTPQPKGKLPVLKVFRMQTDCSSSKVLTRTISELKLAESSSERSKRTMAAFGEMSFADQLTAPEWLRKILSHRDEATARPLLATLFLEIGRKIQERDYSALQRWISHVRVGDTLPVVLVGMLRATFLVRHSLPNWPDLRIRVRKELEDRGMDPTRTLRGLEI